MAAAKPPLTQPATRLRSREMWSSSPPSARLMVLYVPSRAPARWFRAFSLEASISPYPHSHVEVCV